MNKEVIGKLVRAYYEYMTGEFNSPVCYNDPIRDWVMKILPNLNVLGSNDLEIGQ